MQARSIKPEDREQLYKIFESRKIKSADLHSQRIPRSGFFEYNLSYDEFVERTQSPLSLVLQNDRGKILAYIAGYPVSHIRNISNPDIIHRRLEEFNDKCAYLDQLCLEKGVPTHIAMRLFDKWDFIAQSDGAQKAYTAIPINPWKNTSSERVAIYRGFRRIETIEGDGVSLSLFEKPFMTNL